MTLKAEWKQSVCNVDLTVAGGLPVVQFDNSDPAQLFWYLNGTVPDPSYIIDLVNLEYDKSEPITVMDQRDFNGQPMCHIRIPVLHHSSPAAMVTCCIKDGEWDILVIDTSGPTVGDPADSPGRATATEFKRDLLTWEFDRKSETLKDGRRAYVFQDGVLSYVGRELWVTDYHYTTWLLSGVIQVRQTLTVVDGQGNKGRLIQHCTINRDNPSDVAPQGSYWRRLVGQGLEWTPAIGDFCQACSNPIKQTFRVQLEPKRYICLDCADNSGIKPIQEASAVQRRLYHDSLGDV